MIKWVEREREQKHKRKNKICIINERLKHNQRMRQIKMDMHDQKQKRFI